MYVVNCSTVTKVENNSPEQGHRQITIANRDIDHIYECFEQALVFFCVSVVKCMAVGAINVLSWCQS